VIGEFPDLVVLARRRFASDGAVFGAWYSSAVHQDRTVERLRAEPPLFAVQIDNDATFRGRFPLVGAYLDAEFRPIAEIEVPGAGPVRVLVDGRRTPSRVDGDRRWPCFR
jgi:hypothetical protein